MAYGIIASTGLEGIPAELLKSLLLVAIIAIQLYALYRKPSGVPQPFQVEKLDKFATRDFCEMKHGEVHRRLDGHDADVRNLYAELKRDRESTAEHATRRSEVIYRKIEDVRLELTDKIDSMPDRVIETLNTLGKLK